MQLRFVSREKPEKLVAVGVQHFLGDAMNHGAIGAL